jgi:hypothetical protein
MLNPGKANYRSPALFSRFSLLYLLKPEIDEFFNDFLGQDLENESNKAEPGLEKMQSSAMKPERPGLVIQPPLHWKRRTYQRFPGIEGQDFLKLLQELSTRRIVTFLVILPDYVGTNATNYEQDAFKKDLRALAGRFRSVFILDFNTTENFVLDDPNLFSDGGWGRVNSHLSNIGCRIISRKVASAIKSQLASR